MDDHTGLKHELRRKAVTPERLMTIALTDPALARAVAKRKSTPASVLRQLAGCADMPTRNAVAGHANTDADTLARLSRDRQWSVLKAVALNPNTPPTVLRTLAGHKQHTVRQAVASRTSLPPDVHETLSNDPHPAVRQTIAWNPGTTPDVIERLLRDPDPTARLGVLSRQGQAGDWHEVLARDENEHVRAVAAKEGDIAFETLQRLAGDASPLVRRHLAHRCASHPYTFASPEYRTDIANLLINDEDQETREYACGAASPELTAARWNDVSAIVRTVAALRTTDEHVLTQLASDPEASVRNVLIRNPHLPRAAFLKLMPEVETGPAERMLNFTQHPNVPDEGFRAAMRHEQFIHSYGSYLLRDARRLPDDVLNFITEHLTRSEDDSCRLTAARDARTPVHLLEVLLNDQDARTAAAARMTLTHVKQEQPRHS